MYKAATSSHIVSLLDDRTHKSVLDPGILGITKLPFWPQPTTRPLPFGYGTLRESGSQILNASCSLVVTEFTFARAVQPLSMAHSMNKEGSGTRVYADGSNLRHRMVGNIWGRFTYRSSDCTACTALLWQGVTSWDMCGTHSYIP